MDMIRLTWPDDLDTICEIVKSQDSIFKIVLKTKNETDILEDWFQHHLNIVGNLNIIVFDNGSTNRKTFEIYEKYLTRINLFSFHENHNLVHNTQYFLKFYQALQDSAKFYSFIDADEFLYFTDGNSCLSDREFINVLNASSPDTIFFGYWASNVPGNKDIFYISDINNRYISNLKGGKPIISSKYKLKGFINHNIQLYENNPYIQPTGGVLVCHLNMVDKDRRIMINKEKILAHKFLNSTDEIENVLLNIDSYNLSGSLSVYIKEIIKCKNDTWLRIEQALPGCFKINEDRSIDFGDELSHKKLLDFKMNCREHWSALVTKPK